MPQQADGAAADSGAVGAAEGRGRGPPGGQPDRGGSPCWRCWPTAHQIRGTKLSTVPDIRQIAFSKVASAVLSLADAGTMSGFRLLRPGHCMVHAVCLATSLPVHADWVAGLHRPRHRRAGPAHNRAWGPRQPPHRLRRMRSRRPFQRRRRMRMMLRCRRRRHLPPWATSVQRPRHRQPRGAARLAVVLPQRLQLLIAATAKTTSPGLARSEGSHGGQASRQPGLYCSLRLLFVAHSQRLHAWRSRAFRPVAGELCHGIGLLHIASVPALCLVVCTTSCGPPGLASPSPSNRQRRRCTGSLCRQNFTGHTFDRVSEVLCVPFSFMLE